MTYLYGGGLDQLVASRKDSEPLTFYAADDQGSIVMAGTAAAGVVERYNYDDFGRPQVLAPNGTPRTASEIGNRVLYTGRWLDPVAGLYNYRTRWMSPELGRFTTRDTIGIWGDPANLGNGTAYVGNDPWNWVDPWGEQGSDPFLGANSEGLLGSGSYLDFRQAERIQWGFQSGAQKAVDTARGAGSFFSWGTSDPVREVLWGEGGQVHNPGAYNAGWWGACALTTVATMGEGAGASGEAALPRTCNAVKNTCPRNAARYEIETQGGMLTRQGRVLENGTIKSRIDFVNQTAVRRVDFDHTHGNLGKPHVVDIHVNPKNPSQFNYSKPRNPNPGEYLDPVLSDPRIQGGVFNP